ncbi:MAG: hypothetical protein KAY32_16545 [Candidatus Eisenbacteria sp.]|nr:hypothetical protein [Candidatus Eisenbacteria bacterium]
MTRARVTELLHEAIFRVIRRAPPLPTLEEFLDLQLGGLLPGSSPAQWSSFWKEALVASLEEVFRQEGYRIDELSPRVFLRWNRKMRSLRDWVAERVMPLPEDPRTKPPSAPQGPRDMPPSVSQGPRDTPLSASQGLRAKPPPAPPEARRGLIRLPALLAALLLALSLVLSLALFPALLLTLSSTPPLDQLLGTPILRIAPAHGAVSSLAGSTATLERTPADRPASVRFNYDIQVAFRASSGRRIELPREAVIDVSNYELRSDCDPETIVPIDEIVWRGVGDAPDHTTGAVLYARLDPDCSYTLFLAMPEHPPGKIVVQRAEDALSEPAGGFVRFVRFVDRHVSGSLDLRTLEDEEDRVGVDFQAQFDFPVLRQRLFADAIRCRVNATGMLAVDRRARKAHNALDLELALSWLKLYTLPTPRWARRHVHAIGFQLSPAGFESDQDFRVVDYTLGPAVTFSLPLLDWPLLAWHQAIEMPRGFLPPTVRVGYTYLHRVRHTGPDLDDRKRLDVEVVALAPLLRPLDLQVRYRWYRDLERDEDEQILELSWNWYVDRDTRTAVLLKLVHGALPPNFREAQMVGVGFTVGL